MRVLVIMKANEQSEAGELPGEEVFASMTAFDERLAEAGVLLAAEGLTPSSAGKRVRFAGASPSVIDGPFAETKELVAGYWLWQVESLDEAIEWINQLQPEGVEIPPGMEFEVELRPIHEPDDLGDGFTPELRARGERLRERMLANLKA